MKDYTCNAHRLPLQQLVSESQQIEILGLEGGNAPKS